MICPKCGFKMIYHATNSNDSKVEFICASPRCDVDHIYSYLLSPAELKAMKDMLKDAKHHHPELFEGSANVNLVLIAMWEKFIVENQS